MKRSFAFALFLASFVLTATAEGRDWIHWRGPEENGVSREKNLPDTFDPKLKEKGNVLWHQPFGGRSAPLVLDGKLYMIQGTGVGIHEGEQILCFEEKTGKPLWAHRVNVFHTDIVSSRLGWTTLTADPASKTVYAHTTAGLVLAFNPEGKVLWSRSLTEEFGRITGYGGRVVTPLFDSGLCIVGMVNSSWGDHARGANRFVALDGKTGEVVWWADTPNAIRGTYYSSPVIGVIGGQRLMISGGADGHLHAFKVRTGERVWSYRFGAGVVNGSPVIDGNLIYCHHGEENPEGGPIGRVICVDASQIDPKTKSPKLVWQFNKAKRFGLASAALDKGLLYIPDDTGELFCFDAKKGTVVWSQRYGTEVRGAPLIADGKLYIFDVKGRLVIWTLDGTEPPSDEFEYKFRDPTGGLNETNGTVIAVNNRLYFTTRTDLYCVGKPDAKDECGEYKPLPAEAKFDPAAAPASIRIFPAEVTVGAGAKVTFTKVFMDANGRELPRPNVAGGWELVQPPIPKGATAGPPRLDATIEDAPPAGPDAKTETVTITLNPKKSTQQGYLEGTAGMMKAQTRVRVAGQMGYKQDFQMLPPGAAPGGWINVQSKYKIVDLDGNRVLSKVNTDPRPPFARANAYMTGPNLSNYTVQADLMGTEVRNRIPDMGLVNSRYTVILDGKTNADIKSRELRIVSWEARPRVNHAVGLDWKPGTWYTVKFAIEQKEKSAMLRAKVWPKGSKEPEAWSIEFEDESPNREGAAALYGYVSDPLLTVESPGSEIYYDNVQILPSK